MAEDALSYRWFCETCGDFRIDDTCRVCGSGRPLLTPQRDPYAVHAYRGIVGVVEPAVRSPRGPTFWDRVWAAAYRIFVRRS